LLKDNIMKKKEIAKLKPGDIIVYPGMTTVEHVGGGIAVIEDVKKIGKSDYTVTIRKILEFGFGNVLDSKLTNYGRPIKYASMNRWEKLNFEDEDQRHLFMSKSKDIIINLFKYM